MPVSNQTITKHSAFDAWKIAKLDIQSDLNNCFTMNSIYDHEKESIMFFQQGFPFTVTWTVFKLEKMIISKFWWYCAGDLLRNTNSTDHLRIWTANLLQIT